MVTNDPFFDIAAFAGTGVLRHGPGAPARLPEPGLRAHAPAAAPQLQQLLPAAGERCRRSERQRFHGRRRRRGRRGLTAPHASLPSASQSAREAQVS